MARATIASSPAPNDQTPPKSMRQRLAHALGLGVWRADQQFEGYLFVLPSLIGFLLFVLAPIAISLGLSFHEWDLLTPPSFIGPDNYIELLTHDPVFGTVMKNTFWYTILIVPVQLGLGLLLAMALNVELLRGLRFYRMLYFMPVVSSAVAAAMIFRLLFNQQTGVSGLDLGVQKAFC
ncbi:MAG: sugar ABC transporter permease [Anaerolineae bacterium]